MLIMSERISSLTETLERMEAGVQENTDFRSRTEFRSRSRTMCPTRESGTVHHHDIVAGLYADAEEGTMLKLLYSTACVQEDAQGVRLEFDPERGIIPDAIGYHPPTAHSGAYIAAPGGKCEFVRALIGPVLLKHRVPWFNPQFDASGLHGEMIDRYYNTCLDAMCTSATGIIVPLSATNADVPFYEGYAAIFRAVASGIPAFWTGYPGNKQRVNEYSKDPNLNCMGPEIEFTHKQRMQDCSDLLTALEDVLSKFHETSKQEWPAGFPPFAADDEDGRARVQHTNTDFVSRIISGPYFSFSDHAPTIVPHTTIEKWNSVIQAVPVKTDVGNVLKMCFVAGMLSRYRTKSDILADPENAVRLGMVTTARAHLLLVKDTPTPSPHVVSMIKLFATACHGL